MAHLLAGLALFFATACSPFPEAPPSPLNVVLVSIDTLRSDRLGCYGAKDVETPAIDRLAREGVRFERAFSPVPLTLPAHWTILTGVQPWHHGSVDNGMTLSAPPVATLAERFAAAGYDTAAFVAAFVLNRSFGLNRGFARYDDGPAADAALDQLFHATAPADERVSHALAWLRKPRSRPFFLWLHLYDPHAPYEPPPGFRARYGGRLYDGEVAFVDTQVARLLAGLERSGAAERTLVALLSDHGESLGEHGEATHGVLLYDATLQVPLLFRLPQVLPAGTLRSEAVTLADVAPTVLALAGLSASPEVDGIDLFQEPSTRSRRLAAISEYPRRRLGWAGLVAVREGSWKYILAPRPELYRVADDPRERSDRVALEPSKATELARAARLVASALRAQLDARATAEAGAVDRAGLAALGYLTGSGTAASTDADPKDVIGFMADLDRANQALAEGRLDEAESRFRSLLGKKAPPLAALEGLGRITRMQGRNVEAEKWFAQLFARDPDYVAALAQLVALARERGDTRTAVDRARRLTGLAPADASASRLLAEALLAAGDAPAAEAEWRRGLEAAPQSGWLRLGFVRFLVAAHRQGEALLELDRILANEDLPEEVVSSARSLRSEHATRE